MAEPDLGETKVEDNDATVGVDSTGDTASAPSFKDLGLKPELLKALAECGLEQPTEVQQRCIPQILSGKDVLCEAGCGMGRRTTIAMALLQQLQLEDGKISALILCHTRISANKFAENFERFSKHMSVPPKVIVICGGVSPKQDVKALAEGPHIVVGTCGRIKMHLSQKKKPLNLSDVMHFFVHESNEIFIPKDSYRDFQEIEKQTSRQKQVVLFCSQLKEKTKPLYHGYFKEQNLIEIHIEEKHFILEGLQQYYIKIKDEEKDKKLLEFLDLLKSNKVLIYVKDPEKCDRFCERFKEYNIPAFPINRQMSLPDMMSSYKEHKKVDQCVIILTDKFEKELDLKNGKFNIVFNYNVPETPDIFNYMVSKAARLDPKGIAITFVTDREEEYFNNIQDHFGLCMKELSKETFLVFQGFMENVQFDPTIGLSKRSESYNQYKHLRRWAKDPPDTTLLLCLDSC